MKKGAQPNPCASRGEREVDILLKKHRWRLITNDKENFSSAEKGEGERGERPRTRLHEEAEKEGFQRLVGEEKDGRRRRRAGGKIFPNVLEGRQGGSEKGSEGPGRGWVGRDGDLHCSLREKKRAT